MIEYKVEPIEAAQDLWVTVFGVTVLINKSDEGISIDVWPEGSQEDPIASTQVLASEMSVVD